MTEAGAGQHVVEDAFDRLLSERSGALLRTAYLLTGDRARAEDLLRASLAATRLRWRRLGDPDSGEAHARAWMARKYSSRWRRRWDARHDADGLTGGADHTAMRDALASLSKRQRTMVVLRFHEDLTETETADVLGTSVLTVRSTVARALQRLGTAAATAVRTAPDEDDTDVIDLRDHDNEVDDPAPQRTATT